MDCATYDLAPITFRAYTRHCSKSRMAKIKVIADKNVHSVKVFSKNY